MPLTLLIACRIRLLAEGISRLLEPLKDVRIVGIAHDSAELREGLKGDPGLLLTDHAFCREIFSLKRGRLPCKVLCLYDPPLPNMLPANLKEMIPLGLAGLLSIGSDSKQLIDACRAIHRGDLWIDHGTMKKLFLAKSLPTTPQVSERELEVLEKICLGLTNKEIAHQLCVSEQTVKTHCNSLYRKFETHNRVKLVLQAQHLQMIPFPL